MQLKLVTKSTFNRYKKSKGYKVEKESKNDYSRVVYITKDNNRLLPTDTLKNKSFTNKILSLVGLGDNYVVYDLFNSKGNLVESNLISKESIFKHLEWFVLNEDYVLVTMKSQDKEKTKK